MSKELAQDVSSFYTPRPELSSAKVRLKDRFTRKEFSKMKKLIPALLALCLLAALLCGCSGNKTDVVTADVDLTAFMEELMTRYELGSIEAVNDELIDAFYPGLLEVDAAQRVVYMPLITGVVSEYALLQCADKDAAARAAEILQTRMDTQAEGGAWYPESMENWAKAKIVTKGNYVALIAAGDDSAAIAADFEKLF